MAHVVVSLKEFFVGVLQYILFVVWLVSAILLIVLILMHSGKGTGVSDMLANTLYSSNTATGIMEKNLDRLTVVVAIVFSVSVVLCMFFFPQGIVGI